MARGTGPFACAARAASGTEAADCAGATTTGHTIARARLFGGLCGRGGAQLGQSGRPERASQMGVGTGKTCGALLTISLSFLQKLRIEVSDAAGSGRPPGAAGGRLLVPRASMGPVAVTPSAWFTFFDLHTHCHTWGLAPHTRTGSHGGSAGGRLQRPPPWLSALPEPRDDSCRSPHALEHRSSTFRRVWPAVFYAHRDA